MKPTAVLGEDGVCLHGRAPFGPKLAALYLAEVMTPFGVVIRKLVKVIVKHDDGLIERWADRVTGSLFDIDTGLSLSTPNRYIVKP